MLCECTKLMHITHRHVHTWTTCVSGYGMVAMVITIAIGVDLQPGLRVNLWNESCLNQSNWLISSLSLSLSLSVCVIIYIMRMSICRSFRF